MRDLFAFWRRQYSAVSTSDLPTQVVTSGDVPKESSGSGDPSGAKGRRNSFKSGRRMSLDQGIPPIIDSFFYQRKSGEKTRQPKRNNLLSSFFISSLFAFF